MNRAAAAMMIVLTLTTLPAQDLSSADRAKVDAAVARVMASTGVPSVSAGVARGGKVVYTQAFGSARLARNVAINTGGAAALNLATVAEKAVPANAALAYPVGSISKQFTAACILLLQERGKLRLDDPVARFFPELTRAHEVTLRNLLSHTSGYSDYAPQDYTIPAWTTPRPAIEIVHEWAEKPLDFDPGTKWQYSNTNFEIAALIVEKASGQRFHDYLWQNVITPLHLTGVLDLDTERDQLQVRGYEQHALGPMRAAILEAPGWYYGDAQLAMPVATLLQWDMSIAHKTLLKPESYAAMTAEMKLKDGKGTHYGLGVFVAMRNGHRCLYHSGEVGGFVADNVVFPDDDLAYAALTNQEASSAAGRVTASLLPVLAPFAVTQKAALKAGALAPDTPRAEQTNVPRQPLATGAAAAQAQTILTSLQEDDIDRALFTADANFYFNEETLDDFSNSLAPLGSIESVTKTSESLRGGMVFRSFAVKFPARTLNLTTFTLPDGRLEQFLVGPAE